MNASQERPVNSESIPHTIMSTLRCSVCGDRLIEKDHKSLRYSRVMPQLELNKLARSSIAKYESNPTNFMPSEKQPIMPG